MKNYKLVDTATSKEDIDKYLKNIKLRDQNYKLEITKTRRIGQYTAGKYLYYVHSENAIFTKICVYKED